MKITFMGLATILVVGLLFSGCESNSEAPGSGDSQVVARINNYELTVKDFKNEAGRTLSEKYLLSDPIRAKEELLEEIVIKKVLIEEAQKQNFDKNDIFMKEIEKYWEQALLKLLIKKKTEEFSRKIVVSPNEIKIEYERMLKDGIVVGSFEETAPHIEDNIRRGKIQKALDKWITDSKKSASIKINKDILRSIKIN